MYEKTEHIAGHPEASEFIYVFTIVTPLLPGLGWEVSVPQEESLPFSDISEPEAPPPQSSPGRTRAGPITSPICADTPELLRPSDVPSSSFLLLANIYHICAAHPDAR